MINVIAKAAHLAACVPVSMALLSHLTTCAQVLKEQFCQDELLKGAVDGLCLCIMAAM